MTFLDLLAHDFCSILKTEWVRCSQIIEFADGIFLGCSDQQGVQHILNIVVVSALFPIPKDLNWFSFEQVSYPDTQKGLPCILDRILGPYVLVRRRTDDAMPYTSL